MQSAEWRRLGKSELRVSSVSMGCWPITGLTSVDVTEEDSRKTLAAALRSGINFFDTAYAYGIHGESEVLLGQATADRQHDVVIATKGGLHRVGRGQDLDGRPETLHRECRESLKRLNRDAVDLYYLHAPDPNVPVAESAGAIAELIEAGLVRFAGASNCSAEQLQDFHQVCPLTAIQPPYNMLQRQIEEGILPWCRDQQISVCVYWPLMKGLLAGKLRRDHVFPPGDGRGKYEMFQGQEYQRNLDLVEDLRAIAAEMGITVAALVIAWTVAQPGITSALCGAKRDWQIQETAAAMQSDLSEDVLKKIDRALAGRGVPRSRPAV